MNELTVYKWNWRNRTWWWWGRNSKNLKCPRHSTLSERIQSWFLSIPKRLCLPNRNLSLHFIFCRLGDTISVRLFAVFLRISASAERVRLTSSDIEACWALELWVVEVVAPDFGSESSSVLSISEIMTLCMLQIQPVSSRLSVQASWVSDVCLFPLHAENKSVVTNIPQRDIWRTVCAGYSTVYFK